MKSFIYIILIIFSSNSLMAQNLAANQIEFTCTVDAENTLLNWTVNREVNSSYFIIEKSVGGEEFKIIATQKAGSTTYKSTTYSFEDVAEVQLNTTYRISLVNMEGKLCATETYKPLDTNLAKAFAK